MPPSVNRRGATIDICKFKQLLDESDAFRHLLARHEDMALAQAQQIAECNAVHGLDQRLTVLVRRAVSCSVHRL
jgi:hypothetical protein